MDQHKSNLIIMASEGARNDPKSPLIQFIRDYAEILKKYQIFTTKSTGDAILASGLFDSSEVISKRSSAQGGVVQLAAMIARHAVEPVIYLSDPEDLRSNMPENLALQRVCRELENVRLINNFASAEEWAQCQESEPCLEKKFKSPLPTERFLNIEGTEHNFLPIPQQTIALISHDQKKDDMIDFVNERLDFLIRFHRIITTGFTGWLLKVLYAGDSDRGQLLIEAENELGKLRSGELKEMFWFTRLRYSKNKKEFNSLKLLALREIHDRGIDNVMKKLEDPAKKAPKCAFKGPSNIFVQKVMPYPSGPKGGNILIADEILQHTCHRFVFFIDPDTAHAHESDIRLLERTCQIRGVYAVCSSDQASANKSIDELQKKLGNNNKAVLKPCKRRLLCEKYGLKDAFVVNDPNDFEGDDLGTKLARASAGYLLQEIGEASKEFKIGIPHGWTSLQVVKEIEKLKEAKLFQIPLKKCRKVTWIPIVGNLNFNAPWGDEREASSIAYRFGDLLGGHVKTFAQSGLRINKEPPPNDRDIIEELSNADLILVTATTWGENTPIRNSPYKIELFPPVSPKIAGLISVIFLHQNGGAVDSKYSINGLGYDGFRRAARAGKVVLIAGGKTRRQIVLATLKSRLVSALITTSATADWLLEQ